MPKLIDHAQRDREIGEAAMRVLARDGLVALSVRKVAEEAGLATASLRRAFPTQAALRSFCLDGIRSAVADRLRRLDGDGGRRVIAMLEELLPLDEVRRTELMVQLQLGSLALTDGSLAPSVRELSGGVRRVCDAAIAELVRAGEVPASVDAAFEGDRLHALLDGLALRLLWSTDSDAGARARAVLERHFRMLGRGDG
ncbi:TetR/AcrR family transcriptional regulator [Microbacterium sp. 22179]|jgi:AcrR family transcriptional regulator|uniref:TetR/AcrR family transcriptional regulator n=1 Tax=Microbacterium sp. 22179 TaxID=3453886 RepID=UPI003F857888